VNVSLDNIGFDAGGRPLVSNVSLELAAGSVTALIGPNGAGKTTLLRLLAGDNLPSRGSVRYDGEPLDQISVRRRAGLRAVMVQHHASDAPFTVEQVVSMGRYPFRGGADESDAQDRKWVDEAIDSLDLGDIRARPIRLLSGGEQQRVALARILAQQAPLVLFDEPTTALDLGHQEAVISLISDLGLQGHTVVAVLHDLNLAVHFDHVVLLDGGAVVASGDPGGVLTSTVLSAVYHHAIDVVPHPRRHGVLVLPQSLRPPRR
jgi:iron complex transport system ATP-binding protein